MLLGDAIESALSRVGVTKDKVERWLGTQCHCSDRQKKLNELHYWAARVMVGHVNGAKKFLGNILGQTLED